MTQTQKPPIRNKPPSIRIIKDSESKWGRKELLALWLRNLPMASAKRYDWLYSDGPAETWFALGEEESPIGSAGLMARNMKMGEKTLQAGQAIDLNIDREHRSIGPALKLERALVQSAEENGLPFIYGIPNRQAESVLRRVGYKIVAPLQRWAKPLRSEYKLKSRIQNPSLAKLVSRLVDVPLKFTSPEVYRRLPGDWEIEWIDQFDDRFDRLWEKASKQFSIIGERTSDYLNWRYCKCPDLQYEMLGLKERKTGELAGYIVFYCDQGFAHLSDLLFLDEASCDNLLSEFLRLLRRHNLNAVDLFFFGSSRFSQRLARWGFSRRECHRNVLLHTPQSHREAWTDKLIDAENWFLTRADSDTDI